MKPSGKNISLYLLLAWLIATIAVFGIRKMAWFAEWIELPLYDLMTEITWPWKTGHPDIVLVMIQDASRWPLDDPSLSKLIAGIVQGEPAVIAIDLIRDRAVPGDGTLVGLADLVLANPQILMARGIPGEAGQDFAPPPFLESGSTFEPSEQVGIAGFPVDGKRRRVVRRGLVSIEGGRIFSLPALASLRYVAAKDPAQIGAFIDGLERIATVGESSGGYASGNGGGDQFLLKSGPALETLFPIVTAESIATLSRNELMQHFKGKVVFLGTDASIGVKDEIPVPGYPELRGVKALALATAQLIREIGEGETPIRWLENSWENLLIGLAGLVTALLCFKLPGSLLVRVLAMVPLVAAGFFAGGCLALTSGLWIPIGAPIGTVVLTGAASYAIIFSRERRDRLAIYSLMEKNLSPQVAGTIWRNNEALLGGRAVPSELFFGTALFADLKGYSGITETFQQQGRNQEFIAWLNAYLEAAIPIIRHAGGFVQQFAGDGIFVIFGFPESVSHSHAGDAISCAVKIAARIEALNLTNDPALPDYYVRIGIYTGEILCGTVGDSSQMQYTFLGSTINKAARLESLQKFTHDVRARAVRILIGEPTRQEAGDDFKAHPFSDDPVELDPRLPPERVWRIS